MKKTLWILSSLALSSQAFASQTPVEPAPVLSASSCTQTVNEATFHYATMEAIISSADRTGTLTLLQSASNARYAPVYYSLSEIVFKRAPTEPAIFECDEDGSAIAILEGSHIAVINGNYYQMELLNTNVCNILLDAKTRAYATLKFDFDASTLTVLHTSLTGRYAPVVYQLKRNTPPFVEPVDVPDYECAVGPVLYKVWEKNGWVRTSTGYYRIVAKDAIELF